MSLISSIAKQIAEEFDDETLLGEDDRELLAKVAERVIAQSNLVVPAEEDVKLCLAPIDEIVDQLKKRYIGVLVAIERFTKRGRDQQGTRVYYRGGHTLALGLAKKSVAILLDEGDRFDYTSGDVVGDSDEDEDGD